jgi:hypothetical protein
MTTRVPKHLPISLASVSDLCRSTCALPSLRNLSLFAQPQDLALPRRRSCTPTSMRVPQSHRQRQSLSPFELVFLSGAMATSLPKRCQAISTAALTFAAKTCMFASQVTKHGSGSQHYAKRVRTVVRTSRSGVKLSTKLEPCLFKRANFLLNHSPGRRHRGSAAHQRAALHN